MSKKINIDETLITGIGFGGVIVGLIGIGYGLANRKKLNHICNRINTTIDDMSQTIDVDVPKLIVDEAVDRAVEVSVQRAVKNVSANVEKEIIREIESEVRESVRSERENITHSVTKQITNEVAKINVKSLSKVVREDARDLIVQKFDGELDDLLEKYNDNLDNVTKVYSSIAKRFTNDTCGGKDLKISLN